VSEFERVPNGSSAAYRDYGKEGNGGPSKFSSSLLSPQIFLHGIIHGITKIGHFF